MEAGSAALPCEQPGGQPWPALAPPGRPPEPCNPAELRALVLGGVGGEADSEACEKLLALAARAEGALDLAIGDGLAALCLGDRLIRLGFSNLGDYAREVLGIQERTAQAMAHLSRELRTRPLLRAAVRAGEVRPRSAQAVLPVADGDAEARWVERARLRDGPLAREGGSRGAGERRRRGGMDPVPRRALAGGSRDRRRGALDRGQGPAGLDAAAAARGHGAGVSRRAPARGRGRRLAARRAAARSARRATGRSGSRGSRGAARGGDRALGAISPACRASPRRT